MHSLINELKNKRIIAIEGEPAAGKSTLANYLKKELNANVISIDDFYLPIEKRNKETFLIGGNNIDFKRLYEEVISKHLSGKRIDYRSYNCQTNEYSLGVTLSKKPVLIIEGSYVLRSELLDYFDYKILLTIDEKTQEKRLSQRVNYQDFLDRWIPLSRSFIADNSILNKVDKVINDLNI